MLNRTESAKAKQSIACSKGFILCVLYRALDYVRQRHSIGLSVQFPLSPEDVRSWLVKAQNDCIICEESFHIGLGGRCYDPADETTYWTKPQQFYTYWKNNVERKSKLLILQRDAAYRPSDTTNTDEKRMFRAAYCRNAIAISLSIKNYFDRYLPKDPNAKIVQYTIEYPMPNHLTISRRVIP
jgi:hypothetical protein